MPSCWSSMSHPSIDKSLWNHLKEFQFIVSGKGKSTGTVDQAKEFISNGEAEIMGSDVQEYEDGKFYFKVVLTYFSIY